MIKISFFLKKYLRNLGITLVKNSTYDNLISDLNLKKNNSFDIKFLNHFSDEDILKLIKLIPQSKSQIRQDLFTISHCKYKMNGYFVEFGSTNGKDLSNTYLLEKKFNWTGILAEPGKVWHKELFHNRICNISKKCIHSSSSEILEFLEIGELSTLERYKESDHHSEVRKNAKKYKVQTTSLYDLLKEYNAPKEIDYLSIDTEGSEFEILKNFNFNEYSFKIITCEHNFTENREKIYRLLINNNYKRVMEDFSDFDDWYIKSD